MGGLEKQGKKNLLKKWSKSGRKLMEIE